ncbi:ABC transporter substrate-binding protein [Pseudosulfitobacter pseudonitzschiae]|uniref:ABC transporter substrate-binding protein n=1 Tax=Pseudosulfitobacter pseudonitzschiae TaxID=1402135 RepID=UPI001AFB536D|nr:ABC transporter substrate-binding protein [Pseudosulfitobacter pseudonitzschiae]MBM1816758.1 ABC transporter substrate-binding protein [Pseudosulfitobacter pseudonitzschiae]MBM1833568.1 ABC transporter substrate-binding protein [Pseudosulfitobacter pseudonitzschiae]MBM1838435.1 ABC transporter substrate-binding protein [Pseudosulfitobacter pseudonitzschiae]MBM1843485.1 ABC transporter substrate-binding protein [Pseudosulfitobacter pseudonitzschiae]MBM1848351.1 ABC transporter substrate-bind
MTKDTKRWTTSRRRVLQGMGASAVALSAPSIVRAQSAGTIKIGFLTPTTGPLALFGETDGYTVEKVREALGGKIQAADGQTYDLEILMRDSQSDPNRSAEVAAELILNEEVHMLLPASTTDTINPAADQAELFECPCLSTAAPWQAVVFPRGGADNPFNWTYHFFWGLDEALNTFVGLWNSLETNRKVGMLFPQNADGETWGNMDYGLPSPTQEAGFEIDMPGFFQPRTNDFSSMISSFKAFDADIVGGITYVDDLTNFVNQCAQQRYNPKAITVAAALLFPSGIESLGELGDGMSSEVWWTPAFPFKSSLTGQLSRDVADVWESETGRQWTQPLGYSHAIWEITVDALRRSANPLDRTANRDALKATNMQTLIGPIDFASGPHPNVSTTPIFGGQWVKGEKWPYELKIVDNTVNPLFEPEQAMKPLAWAQ